VLDGIVRLEVGSPGANGRLGEPFGPPSVLFVM
jgi:hypothetical protein